MPEWRIRHEFFPFSFFSHLNSFGFVLTGEDEFFRRSQCWVFNWQQLDSPSKRSSLPPPVVVTIDGTPIAIASMIVLQPLSADRWLDFDVV
ncbi:hypothetical protein OH492_00080 [Vibrio chagasii]|nr:hypothetical protein [Vibrio chagasii]